MDPVTLLVIALIGGTALAGATLWVLWRVVSAAVQNFLDWLVLNFGNDAAVKTVAERREREAR